jgi:hypothetical protein
VNRRLLIGVFEREEDILNATRASRALGYTLADAYVPYAVHGLDEAMGLAPSRLPWVCFALGVAGAAFKVWFEFWTTSVNWPVNVGGKPWNSLPAFIPITFEVMVLTAGVSTVLAFLAVARLLPGRKPRLPRARVTDDEFVLVLEESDAAFDVARVRRLLGGFNAVRVEERVEEA